MHDKVNECSISGALWSCEIQKDFFSFDQLNYPRRYSIEVLWYVLDLSQSFGFAAGDVHWPGGQGYPEVAPSILPTCSEAGKEGDYRVRNALHPCHGSHSHFLHTAHIHHGPIPGKPFVPFFHLAPSR